MTTATFTPAPAPAPAPANATPEALEEWIEACRNHQAFSILEKFAGRNTGLPFMFMGWDPGTAGNLTPAFLMFKHIATRNYLLLTYSGEALDPRNPHLRITGREAILALFRGLQVETPTWVTSRPSFTASERAGWDPEGLLEIFPA